MARRTVRSGVARNPLRTRPAPQPTVIDRVMDMDDSSLLDVLDHVLAKGVMATGDLTLGVAGIDLIYVRLSALLCSADRVLPQTSTSKRHAKRSASKTVAGRPQR